jgi:HEAT repeat protein
LLIELLKDEHREARAGAASALGKLAEQRES